MRITLTLLFTGLFMFCTGAVSGQADTLSNRSLIIKFSPQHILLSGLHLELERSVGADSRHSILFSPRIYSGSASYTNSLYERESILDEQTEVAGYGGAVLHRIYTADNITGRQEGMYLSYGIDYHHFNISFVRNGYTKEIDDEGLEYYKYRERPFTEKIDRYGVVAMLGHQGPFIHHRLVADLSFGFGYHESNSKTNYTGYLFGEGAYDYGHSGVYLLLNFKIGIAL